MALILPAYAKLNLTLDVVGRRPNGYHDIESVMQTISLHDLVSVDRTDCRVFDVVGPAIAGENLVLKAARELEAHTGRAMPFTIRLFKRVPMGAGMGGGSADAAAFLRAAIQLYRLQLSSAEVQEIAESVGQDVPFFLNGGTARASGLGATVERLPALEHGWSFVVVCPAVEVGTRTVYEAVDETAVSAHRTPTLVTALRGGARIDAEMTGNDLERTTRRLFPALDQALAALRGRLNGLRMTGSGAAFYGIYRAREEAEAARAAATEAGLRAWLCHPVPAWS